MMKTEIKDCNAPMSLPAFDNKQFRRNDFQRHDTAEIKIDKKPNFLLMLIPSSLSQIGLVIDICTKFMRERAVCESNSVMVILREMVSNAICHGNKKNPDLGVYIKFEHVRDNLFSIVVQDEGSGFDYASLTKTLPDNPRKLRRYGFALIFALSEHVRFNDRGNCITAYVTID